MQSKRWKALALDLFQLRVKGQLDAIQELIEKVNFKLKDETITYVVTSDGIYLQLWRENQIVASINQWTKE